ncbi:MAG: response regulator [Anaerolineae bacterium]|nr:response regulator [Anaerolineae bacterium]NIN96485.1 response regulator [Anaerolineae bacterium]NIQ79513.1 response regulator [Anaerolineae bacterium]
MTDTILIVDDDLTLIELLSHSLEKTGYEVLSATNGIDALQMLYKNKVDLVILDVMMPRMDGWETSSRMREISDVPIIMLTAKDDEADTLKGFQCGVDDYVTKPFSFAELTARVKAILQRSRKPPSDKRMKLYIFDDLVVDAHNSQVTVRGEPVSLTPTEFQLLLTLAENAGRILSHEQLLDRVWGPEYVGETGYVKRYIWYLRQKIEDDPSDPHYIVTERGFGYKLEQ